MLIAHRFAGFSMNEADGLRKAMGKKKLSVMLKYKQQFVDGCVTHGGCEKPVAEAIWEVMEQFAKYAFNKSHTTAYAVLSYQTAFLKANYPVQFLAALMSCDLANTDKLIAYVEECRRLGIDVFPPDVNRSGAEFTVEPGGSAPSIRFGLLAVKGVGQGAVDSLVAARQERGEPFATLPDVCENADLQQLNRASLEALARSGALDSLGGHRAQLHAAVDASLRMATTMQEDRRAGQMNLFGGGDAAAAPAESRLPDVEPWTESEVLVGEKETLGLYMSSHPLARHSRTLATLSTANSRSLGNSGEGARVCLGGMIGQVKTMYPRSGRNQNRKMARFRLEDFDGSVACVMFSDAFERDGELLTDEAIGFVDATVDTSREETSLKVDRFIPVEKAYDELAGTLVLAPQAEDGERVIEVVERLIREHPGKRRLLLDLSPVSGVRAIYRVERGGIAPSRALHDAAVAALGEPGVRWKTRSPTPTRR